jgi:hypothetical protein
MAMSQLEVPAQVLNLLIWNLPVGTETWILKKRDSLAEDLPTQLVALNLKIPGLVVTTQLN